MTPQALPNFTPMAVITRAIAKRLIREKTGKRVQSDSTDILISLNYTLFMRDLLIEAQELATRDGSVEILPTHIRLAQITILKKYKG